MRLTTKIKFWFERFLLDHIALPIIRRQGERSSYVRHYRTERRFSLEGQETDEMDAYMDRQVCDLLCLLSTQGDTGFSIGIKLHLFDKAASFGLLSPLTFAADEFSGDSFDGKSMQNKRLTSVFIDLEGRIYDIYAFRHRTSFVHNTDTHKTEKGDDLTWSGSVWIYDDVDNTGWGWYCKGYIRPDNNRFTGKNRVVVPTVEIVDNTCDRGTFIVNISKKSAIPQEFFKDYYLLPTRNRDYYEDMAFLEGHHEEFMEALEKL